MTANPAPTQEQNPKSYIILPRKHSRDILVSQQITDKDLSWYKTHIVLPEEGFFMPTPRQFFNFLNLLRSPERLYDGMGKRLSTAESDQRKARILNNILAQRDPWRAEHLDAHFVNFNGRMYIRSSYRTIDGKFEHFKSAPLEKCVMENYYVDLTIMNGQGLPTRKLRKQNYRQGRNIYFWPPNANHVAVLSAGSDGVELNCSIDPIFSKPNQGVRRMKFFEE